MTDADFATPLGGISSNLLSQLRTELPERIDDAILVLPEEQQLLVAKLFLKLNQSHLFEGFDSRISASIRQQFGQQLFDLDKSYSDGGLEGYLANAVRLLEDSRTGSNPYAGWTPSLPTGETCTLGTDSWKEPEEIGLKELGHCGFVLVAGGLGERLGYKGIKIGLPTEMSTETCYIEYYIEYILAVQKKYAGQGKRLPLCIMTSKDTHDKTLELLTRNNYFGMDEAQITLVQQGLGVPALLDNHARIAVSSEDHFKILTKPHGHGDIHELLYRHDVAKKWLADGIRWITMFQDTNGLAFHSLPLMLGVSKKSNFIMNSLTVPRKAKQAIGGIVKLTNACGQSRTINVEYNQLDGLLRSSSGMGDENDPEKGCSPYPGNINQLVFHLESYCAVLQRTRGLMPEFVNPKYKDETKTAFKSPTRLECMMQDFPTVLEGKEMEKVGFTTVATELCFSPVKNAVADGVKLQDANIQPATAATGEADQYNATRVLLRSIGCIIDDALPETYQGIRVVPGPALVFKPDFVTCAMDYNEKFPCPSKIKISPRSTLIVRGSGVVIESLDLDGAYVIDCRDGEKVVLCDKVVKNEGWQRVCDENSTNEIIKMRGYRIVKTETETFMPTA